MMGNWRNAHACDGNGNNNNDNSGRKKKDMKNEVKQLADVLLLFLSLLRG